MRKLFKNNTSGFTILEVAVALFVLSMGILGIMALVNQNIRVKQINKNKVIASQLAQEGIEVVRSIRDNNWLDKDPWTQGIINDGEYTVDYNSGVVNVSDVDDLSATGTKLYLDQEGFYRHFSDPQNASSTTLFRRIIKVDPGVTPSDASSSVKSIVQWEERGNTHQYTAETVLYNWRKNN